MKKIIACIMAVLFIITGMTSCNTKDNNSENNKIKIIATIFPQYDWVRNILGDQTENVELTLLLDKGLDLHNYQPTMDDIVKISDCDMFIYVGGESDSWAEDALKNAKNKDMITVNLLDVLGDAVKEEEIKEGMEHEHENEESHDHEEEQDHENELDEHVWLSLKNARTQCTYISEKLSEMDNINAQKYKSNTEEYNKELTAMDNEYKNVVDKSTVKTLLFADRFPFRYLVDDYGLDYYAAFSGCYAETEASFETIVFLSQKVNELKLKNIMVLESSDKSIAQAVSQNTTDKNQNIHVLDSMQSVTLSDISNGVTYLSIAEKNLNTLKNVLN